MFSDGVHGSRLPDDCEVMCGYCGGIGSSACWLVRAAIDPAHGETVRGEAACSM